MKEHQYADNPFGLKRITEYSAGELDLAIEIAKDHCEPAGLDFYAILRGIDAYMERRRRKAEAQNEASHASALRSAMEK